LSSFLSDPKFNVNVKNSQGLPALLIAAKNGEVFLSAETTNKQHQHHYI
jgi:hypothetical protein